MGERLIEALREVTPVVIDFEYTTPRGAPPEPIEVAVLTLEVHDGRLAPATRWHALMRPPEHAELTSFDINQTGITARMLADRPTAADVLADLDNRFTAGPYVLVAHHAPAEAKILFNYRAQCPNLAKIDFLDTVRLAKDLFPGIPKHGLDDLLRHLRIPSPPDRHRAMADVEVTAELFIHMINHGRWTDMRQLRSVAGCPADAAQPEQTSLFD